MVTTIVLIDDDALVRAGLKLILGGAKDLQVVAEGADGDEVAALVAEHRPDVVMLDIRMPRVNGLDAARELLADRTVEAITVVAPLISTKPATRNSSATTACTGFSGSSVRTRPNRTATTVWTANADATPIHTYSGRYFVASTSVAMKVLSGSSTRNSVVKTVSMRAISTLANDTRAGPPGTHLRLRADTYA